MSQKEMTMKTIKAELADLKLLGIKSTDLVTIEGLTRYGFDDEIINGLLDYEIMPDVLVIDGKYYVQRKHITMLINRFAKNELTLYKTVDEKNKLVAEAQAYLEENKKLITPEQLELIKEGKLDILEVLKLKDEASNLDSIQATN